MQSALTRQGLAVFNKPLRVTDVLKDLSRIVPKLKYRILNIAKSEIQHQYLNSSKACRILSWHVHTDIHEGIQMTAAGYAKHRY